jgi:hypothetical protein
MTMDHADEEVTIMDADAHRRPVFLIRSASG